MGNLTFVDNLIERKLLGLHCAYIGRVIAVAEDLSTASVQPLGKTRAVGGEAQSHAVITDVPVACRYHMSVRSVYVEGERLDLAEAKPLVAGDLAVCVCADRNISGARRGLDEVPPAGRHSLSDSIIVGILG